LRYIGSEQEWCITAKVKGEAVPDFFIDNARFETFLRKCIGSPFLPAHIRFAAANDVDTFTWGINGSRVYKDTGSHFEIASPIAWGPLWATAFDIAGQTVVGKAIKVANQLWADEGIVLAAYKNNLAYEKTETATEQLEYPEGMRLQSYGTHENYSFNKKAGQHEYFVQSAMQHLISRFFAAAGWVGIKAGKMHYFLFQRGIVTHGHVGNTTMSTREIINTRGEGLTNDKYHPRQQFIIGDALMFEPAIFLKFGTTAMVLDLIESGYLKFPPWGNIEHPVVTFHHFTNEGLSALADVGGKKLTMVDIQERFFELAIGFYQKHRHISPRIQQVFHLWQTVIDCARQPEPYVALSAYVDGAAKKVLIEQDMEKRGYDWNTRPSASITRRSRDKTTTQRVIDHVKEFDLKFSWIDERGYAQRLLSLPECSVPRIVSDKTLYQALYDPPPLTSSFGFSKFLKRADERGRECAQPLRAIVDCKLWYKAAIEFPNGTSHQFSTKNPSDVYGKETIEPTPLNPA